MGEFKEWTRNTEMNVQYDRRNRDEEGQVDKIVRFGEGPQVFNLDKRQTV